MRIFLRRNLPLLIVMGVLTSLVAIAAAKQPPVLPAGSWGLSFQTQGQPPVGNTSNDRLKEYGAVYLGDTSQRKIYLTFDSGYENGCTAGILDTLKEKNVRAVFFVTYDYCKRNPELVKRMIAEGHTVGNHTWSHPSLPECSPDELYSELSLLHEYVRDEFGYDMYVMRPPKGEFSQRVLACAKELGYTTVLWSFAYPDWDVNNQPDPEQAFQKITGKSHNGAVYLLHAVSETNAAILGRVIDYWRDNGFVITPM